LDPSSAVAIDFAHFLLILQLFEDPLRHDEDRHGILSSMPAIWYASNGNHLPHQQLESDHPAKKTFLEWLVYLYPFASWIFDGHCNLITMPSATILLTVYDCMWWLHQMTVNCLQETILILWSQCQKIGSLLVLKKMTALFFTVTTSKQAQI